ncbi:hypothetical protein ACOME3_005835 [Neoechinorhynchus agilis]
MGNLSFRSKDPDRELSRNTRYVFDNHPQRSQGAGSPASFMNTQHQRYHSGNDDYKPFRTPQFLSRTMRLDDSPTAAAVKPVAYRPSNDSFPNVFVALYDFNGSGIDDLPFRKGDKLVVLDNSNNDWWLVRNARTHEQGYAPTNFLSLYDDLRSKDWYFHDTNLREAERLLDQPFNNSGTFLIRPSCSTKGNYALSILDYVSCIGCEKDTDNQSSVKHYRILRGNDGRFYIGPRATFGTLQGLVDHYKQISDGLCCRLTYPCPKTVPTLPDLSYDDLDQVELDRKCIRLINKIGSGNYGEVWKGKYKGQTVAIKAMKSTSMDDRKKLPKNWDFLEEARVMKKLKHEKIVKLYGVSTVQEPFFIIVEYLLNGNLLHYLRSDMGQQLKLPKLVSVAAQICEGMSYLEKKHYVHCDLAARNIFVGESLLVKIGDFGLARMVESGALKVESQTQFPIKWTAPEAATCKVYTIKSDVWSFGVLLFELITKGAVPYPTMSNQETLQKVSRGYRIPRPSNCPDGYYSIMLRCWNATPELRPTFDYLYDIFDDYFITTEPNYRESEDL